MKIPQFPRNPSFFFHKYLQNIILWFRLLRSVSHSGGRQGSAELIFFARTDRTHCLRELFGRTDPNRRVGRSLLIHIYTSVDVAAAYISFKKNL